MKRIFILLATLAAFVRASPALAQERVATCVDVDAPDAERAAFTRLVEGEVDRHPSHQTTHGACAAHLRVELVELSGDRFLTGRLGGEVPQRVRVEGKGGAALERALGDLLRTVLGNDPIVLRAPGGQSWVAGKLFELKSEGRTTIDVGAFETAHLVSGKPSFLPGLSFGMSREVAAWQIGGDASFAQGLQGHAGRADLDTEVRLNLTTAFFFSPDTDASLFAGACFALVYDRFTGPRGADIGGGTGSYNLVGPGIGLRFGAELFRTTTTRVNMTLEAFLPMYVGNDQQDEVFKGWTPSLTLGAGARF